VYRPAGQAIEVLAVHPGGPFWVKKDKAAWSIPKGEVSDGEDPYTCARREFEEEIGQAPPDGSAIDLGEVRQAGGKVVRAWSLLAPDGSLDAGAIRSNEVEIEWPKGSGTKLRFPEVDKAEWMSPETAREKLVPAQVALLERLVELLGG
jgi:predicted NUDIX family NTP pyrophosphohydrolase